MSPTQEEVPSRPELEARADARRSRRRRSAAAAAAAGGMASLAMVLLPAPAASAVTMHSTRPVVSESTPGQR
jgi:ferric-dicitrate binding protein FerR (iron transport regulator)